MGSSESLPPSASSAVRRALNKWGSWAFAIVPLVGVVELVAHVRQTHNVVPESDWVAARAAVVAIAKPEDLVVFSPRWVDPIGREEFGDKVATLSREAPPDATRFSRAIEVSIRGIHDPELATWKVAAKQTTGAITITTFENPTPAPVIDDLFNHMFPADLHVTRIDGGREADCGWNRLSVGTGGLGFGIAVPADRWVCPGTFVGVSVVPDLDYYPHRCIYAAPTGIGSVLRLHFDNVTFGAALHGYHGIYVEAERMKQGAPVTMVWTALGRKIGSVTHADGDGWKRFELPTPDMVGQKGDLVAEISAPNGNRRLYCFEADTR